LFTALLQNTADDFAFKTTYTHLNVKRPLLLNKKFYQPTSIEPVEDFFNSVKPFHTKLLSSMDSNTHGESTNIEVDEVSRNTCITIKHGDHTLRTWAGDTVLSGGGFSSNVPTDEDYSMFNFQPADFEFDYDGNIFDQPDKEGWGEELMPVDYTENISILVQTNASGSTETADTRTFRINMYEPQGLQESVAIVDTYKTTTTANITATDTTIPLVDAGLMDRVDRGDGDIGLVPGVVWIGTERIEYNAVSGENLVFCTRGTRGTSSQAHTSGATVTNAGPSQRIPTVQKFSHYEDGLRLAYNDSGISLSAAGISPEHAFIRNAGQGSI